VLSRKIEGRIYQREEGFKHCTERSENGSLTNEERGRSGGY